MHGIAKWLIGTGLSVGTAGVVLQVGGPSAPRAVEAEYSARIWGVGGSIPSGRAARLGVLLRDPAGRLVRELEPTHERPIHAILVSHDLGWFDHTHPRETGVGTYEAQTVFPAGGTYIAFLDFATPDTGGQLLRRVVAVDGQPAPDRSAAIAGDTARERTVDGYQVRVRTADAVRAGFETRVAYTVEREGRPVEDLEPYLGAMGHLVAISADTLSFVHGHPVGATGNSHGEHAGHQHAASASGEASGQPGQIEFAVTFPGAGVYRVWMQFQHQGKVMTAPFTIIVEPAEAGGDAAPGAGGHHH